MTKNVNTDAFRVPVGKQQTVQTWRFNPGFRTPKQFQAVREIVNEVDFDFSCSGKLFDPEGSKNYTGPFVFPWFDKSGKLHYARIGARGNIMYSGIV